MTCGARREKAPRTRVMPPRPPALSSRQPFTGAFHRRGTHTMHIVVERELEVRLVLAPERSIPVAALLAYRSDDPYAVHITFHTDSASPVRWTFARDLLIEGVFRACGHGDVRVWPSKADGHGVVLMAL